MVSRMDVERGPASPEMIRALEARWKRLPEEVKRYWSRQDGAKLRDGIVYGVGEIQERNETFALYEWARKGVAVGDDGGGNSFLLMDGVVLRVGAGDGGLRSAVRMGAFGEWLEWMRTGPLLDPGDGVPRDRIVRIRVDGVEDRMEAVRCLRKEVCREVSASKLLQLIRVLPVELPGDRPLGRTMVSCRKLLKHGVHTSLIGCGSGEVVAVDGALREVELSG